MDTVRQAEETYVDLGKDGVKNTEQIRKWLCLIGVDGGDLLALFQVEPFAFPQHKFKKVPVPVINPRS
jgi:hypothetical protein